MAETQNPIEVLRRVLTKFEAYTTPDIETTLKADARKVPGQVEAVVEALRVAQELAERPDKVGFHEEADFVVWQREANLSDRNTRKALALFTEQATHDHAPGFPAHEHPDGEPPPRIVDSSQSS